MDECQTQLKEMTENAEKQKIEQERFGEEERLKNNIKQLEEEKARKKREFEIFQAQNLSAHVRLEARITGRNGSFD